MISSSKYHREKRAPMKKSLMLLLSLPVLMVNLASVSQPDNRASSYHQALRLVINGQFLEAQNLFKQVLKKDPFYIYCRRGLDLVKDLNNGAVLPEVAQVIASGMEADFKYDWQEAIDEYRKAMEIAPSYYFVLHNLGTSLFESGQIEKAITMFEKALKQKEDYPYTHNNLGLALNSMGRFKEALAHYQRAIALFPQYHKAYNNMGANFMSMGMEKEGNAMFKKALEVNAGYTLAFQNVSLQKDDGKETIPGDKIEDTAMTAVPAISTKQLLETLKHGQVMEKKQSQEELSIRKDLAATEDLIQKLQDPSPLLRAAAAEILGNMESREALSSLIKLVNDPEWTVRRSAVGALGRINEPSALPVLLSALQDPDFHTRWAAVYAAAMSKSPLALEPLLQMLNDPIVEVREACVRFLPYMIEVIPRETIIGLLRHERGLDRTLGVRLVDAGKLRMETTEETTSLYVADHKWKKLEDMGLDGATALRAALDFQDPETRIEAVNTLGRMAGRETLDHLYYALKDKDAKVRNAACKGLKRATGQNFQTVEQWLEYFQNINN